MGAGVRTKARGWIGDSDGALEGAEERIKASGSEDGAAGKTPTGNLSSRTEQV